MKQLAVITPVFGNHDLLMRAGTSLTNQDKSGTEIIWYIQNDHPEPLTQRTRDDIEALGVKTHIEEHGFTAGPSAARNRACLLYTSPSPRDS